MNGRFIEKGRACVSFLDHGFLYGDGVFETLRAYNGKIFMVKEHIKRLFSSTGAIRIKMPFSMPEIEKILYKTIGINKIEGAYIRITVTRGTGEPGLDTFSCKSSSVIVYAKNIRPHPERMYRQGIRAVIVGVNKIPPGSLNPAVKSCNFLSNIMAKIEARALGATEGIMLSQEGYVAEGTASNIFMVKKEVLTTPLVSTGILEGITRQVVIKIARKSKIKVIEEKIKKEQLYNSDEIFLTSTLLEVMPVTEIDGRIVANGKPGTLTRLLLDKYRKETLE